MPRAIHRPNQIRRGRLEESADFSAERERILQADILFILALIHEPMSQIRAVIFFFVV
jgi:hypothetical protein